jgi:predicted nucleic acid-binding protein
VRLYLDANTIIYAIESSPPFRDMVIARILQVESAADGIIITSLLSKLECRVKPLRESATAILAQYEGFFAGGW